MEEQNMNQTPTSPEPVDTKLAEAPTDPSVPQHEGMTMPVEPEAVSAQPTTDVDHLLQAHAKKRSFNAVALIAIIVALVIAGLAVFLYLRSMDTAEPSTTTDTTTTTEVSAKDVDDLNTSLDEAIDSTDDVADFNDTDLSDSTLNL